MMCIAHTTTIIVATGRSREATLATTKHCEDKLRRLREQLAQTKSASKRATILAWIEIWELRLMMAKASKR